MKYYFILFESLERNIIGTNITEDELENFKKINKNKIRIIKKQEIPEELYIAMNSSPFIGDSKSVS